jgi:hypothetical protein
MNNKSASTVKTKNIWVDVDQYYENTLSTDLVQEMEKLGLNIYESEGIPRILHKDSLSKVLNYEFQILENNKVSKFRLKVKDNFYDRLFFSSMSSLIWSTALLFLGLGFGTLIEHLLGIDISYSILLMTVMYCLIKHGVFDLIAYSISSQKHHLFYGVLILIGINIFIGKELYHSLITLQKSTEPLSFLIFIQTLLTFLPILIHFLWYTDFLNYILKKNNIVTEKQLISVDDFPGYGSISFKKLYNREDLVKWEEEYNQYFDKIKLEEKEMFIKRNYRFYTFWLNNTYKDNKFIIVFTKKIDLDGIYHEIQNKNYEKMPNHLLGPVYSITYSANKNFIHIGNLPVDEEKLAMLVTEKPL